LKSIEYFRALLHGKCQSGRQHRPPAPPSRRRHPAPTWHSIARRVCFVYGRTAVISIRYRYTNMNASIDSAAIHHRIQRVSIPADARAAADLNPGRIPDRRISIPSWRFWARFCLAPSWARIANSSRITSEAHVAQPASDFRSLIHIKRRVPPSTSKQTITGAAFIQHPTFSSSSSSSSSSSIMFQKGARLPLKNLKKERNNPLNITTAATTTTENHKIKLDDWTVLNNVCSHLNLSIRY